MKIPPIGLGTWALKGKECTEIVEKALGLGYRHIDTAHVYENHQAISKGIKGFDRSQLFLTSKLALDEVHFKDVEGSVDKACDRALKELGVNYLDLYLIHWPDHTLSLDKIFEAMQKLVKEGKILHAGVSNFTIHHLEDLKHTKLIPFANQVEFHPYLYQKDLLTYCRKHEIELIAYRSFGKKELLEEPLFEKIGRKHKKSGAQVILRWLVQLEVPAIPKASSEKHLRENLDVFDFALDDSEMEQINSLNRNHRFCGSENPEFQY